ncbi:MAG: mitochondrial carrier domain-containing protein [Monoraphidium minutum]|nr:MAG: mitochondrial carrier domain-containing protein [Monoraphidium minutum]
MSLPPDKQQAADDEALFAAAAAGASPLSAAWNQESWAARFLDNARQFSVQLVCAGGSGAIAKTAVAPLERAKILAQVQPLGAAPPGSGYTGPWDALWRMRRAEGGWRVWFRGNGANVMRLVPEVGFKFAVHDQFRVMFSPPDGSPMGVREKMAAGAATGAPSRVFVTAVLMRLGPAQAFAEQLPRLHPEYTEFQRPYTKTQAHKHTHNTHTHNTPQACAGRCSSTPSTFAAPASPRTPPLRRRRPRRRPPPRRPPQQSPRRGWLAHSSSSGISSSTSHSSNSSGSRRGGCHPGRAAAPPRPRRRRRQRRPRAVVRWRRRRQRWRAPAAKWAPPAAAVLAAAAAAAAALATAAANSAAGASAALAAAAAAAAVAPPP